MGNLRGRDGPLKLRPLFLDYVTLGSPGGPARGDTACRVPSTRTTTRRLQRLHLNSMPLLPHLAMRRPQRQHISLHGLSVIGSLALILRTSVIIISKQHLCPKQTSTCATLLIRGVLAAEPPESSRRWNLVQPNQGRFWAQQFDGERTIYY